MAPTPLFSGHSSLSALCATQTRDRRGELGFSLVEVVLALGLCVFSLVSLVSLLPVSLDSARNAVEITRRAEAIQQVVTELSQSRFSNFTTATEMERAFTYDGNPTTEPKQIYFKVRAFVNPTTLMPGAAAPSASMARVSLTVATPRETMAGKTAITIPDMGY